MDRANRSRLRRQGVIARRLAMAGLLLLALALPAPRPASAHADLVAADPPTQSILPEAPTQMRFWFTEPLERFEIQVLNASQQRVDMDDARIVEGTGQLVIVSLQPGLPDGIYRTTWEALSPVDGHITRGTIPFFIGQPSELPGNVDESTSVGSSGGALGAVARALAIIASITAVGSVWFVLLVQRRTLRLMREDTGPLEELSTAQRARATESVGGDSTERLLNILAVASVMLLIGLAIQALVESDLGGFTLSEWIATSRGNLWVARAVLGVVLLGAALWMRQRAAQNARLAAQGKRPRAFAEQPEWWILAALGAALLLVSAMGSHIAGMDDVAAAGVASDFIHLAAASMWIGGLVQLRWGVLPALAPLDGPSRTRLLSRVIRRFSIVAGAAVVVVSVSGTYQLVRLLGEPSVLREEAWGQLLVLKLALILLALPLAGINLLRISPRLKALAGRLDTASREAAARIRLRFRHVVTAEALLLIGVLSVVGLMVGTAPGTTTSARGFIPDGWFSPIVRHADESGLDARLTLSPGTTGVNRYDVILTTEDGLPERGTELFLEFRHDSSEEVVRLPLAASAPTLYSTWGREFETAGDWHLTLIVRRPDAGAETEFPFDVTVPAAPPTEEVSRP